ncbi:MAG: hypothetical protein ABI406_09615 [Ktedonobacteraceae bacterium]
MKAIRIEGVICEGQERLDTADGRREVRVTIIRGGASINGYYYAEPALRAIAALIENAHAYVDHARTEADTAVRSVRDMVGFYHSPEYILDESNAGRVDATLHILESAEWLWSMIREAVTLGRPELIGLSIDIYGTWQPRSDLVGTGRQRGTATQSQAQRTGNASNAGNAGTSAQPLKEVTGVLALNSCDVVTRPSAGGSFQRVLQAHMMSMKAGATPDEGAMLMNEQQQLEETQGMSAVGGGKENGKEITEGAGNTHVLEQEVREAKEAHTLRTSLLEELRLERAQLRLERRLLEAALPEAIKTQLQGRYAGRVFEMEELERDITGSRQMLTELSAQGLVRGQVRGHGHEKVEVGMQVTEAEKMQAAFDGMLGLDIDQSRYAGVRGFTSIREAYARVTGDASVSGISERSQVGNIRVSEAAPITRITEADTTTASFSYLLGTSMNKRLLKDYQAWPAEWMKFSSIVPIKDFKQQSRVRLGAFGSLPVVAEDTAYSAITLTDTAATYVPQKRGNLVTVSREVIVNDDLQAIKQIPTKLAVSAAYTLAEFVYGFLSSNPNIYDGLALFTSGAPHNNLGSSALSTGAMQNGVTAMREQANFAGKRIGLRPRFLVVPPELEWSAMVMTKSAGVPGSNNNDINPMMGYVAPVVSPQLASTTQWFLIADPLVVDTVEIGFVGGQVNPALFIQDQPLFGLNFTQDVISYKIRHEYGGAVVDYRGFYRGI